MAEGAMAGFLTLMTSVFETFATLIVKAFDVIISHPVPMTIFGVFFVGAIVGLAQRFMRLA